MRWRYGKDSWSGKETDLFALSVNPFTAPACNISGLKSAHIHACKQYIWWSYNKFTFKTVHFDRNPFACSCEGADKPWWFQIWHSYWSFFCMFFFFEWRRGKHGSDVVKLPESFKAAYRHEWVSERERERERDRQTDRQTETESRVVLPWRVLIHPVWKDRWMVCWIIALNTVSIA